MWFHHCLYHELKRTSSLVCSSCTGLLLARRAVLISAHKFLPFYLPRSVPQPTWGGGGGEQAAGWCRPALHSEIYEFCHFAKKATVVKGKEHKRSCLSPPPLQFLPCFAQFIFEKTFALGMTLVWVCCLSTGGDFAADDSVLARAGQALCHPLLLILCGSFRQNP